MNQDMCAARMKFWGLNNLQDFDSWFNFRLNTGVDQAIVAIPVIDVPGHDKRVTHAYDVREKHEFPTVVVDFAIVA